MRILQRNTKTVYIAHYLSETEDVDLNGDYTGEKTATYTDPLEIRASVVTVNGRVALDKYGIASHKVCELTLEKAIPIAKDDRVWIGKTPASPFSDYNFVVSEIRENPTSAGTYLVAVKELV